MSSITCSIFILKCGTVPFSNLGQDVVGATELSTVTVSTLFHPFELLISVWVWSCPSFGTDFETAGVVTGADVTAAAAGVPFEAAFCGGASGFFDFTSGFFSEALEVLSASGPDGTGVEGLA